MGREDLLARMSSRELTAWMAYYAVKAEEAEHQQDLAESGDGVVVVHGRDPDADDDEDDGDGDAGIP